MAEEFLVDWKVDQPAVLSGKREELYALITIKPNIAKLGALLESGPSKSLAAHVVVIVDVSGSMQTLIREDVLRCVGGTCPFPLARTHERSSCRSFVTSLQRISHEAGMPITTSPGFCKYSVGVEQVEPMFKFIMQTLPQIQLILVILPGKSPVYGERGQ